VLAISRGREYQNKLVANVSLHVMGIATSLAAQNRREMSLQSGHTVGAPSFSPYRPPA
jgi:hypothetical protein